MHPFFLVETITQDKLVLPGIYFEPAQQTKRALLWVHGLTSTFYSSPARREAFATECQKAGYGFAVFNNRGSGVVSSTRKIDQRKKKGYTHITTGASYENFKESVFDIKAGIDFLVTKGYAEIIVIGHSSGANKVCYYAATKKDARVVGVVLASPLSDRLSFDPGQLAQDIAAMQEMIAEGRGDELVVSEKFFPITPKRYVSLFATHSLEDQFDYGDEKPRLTYLQRIKKPLLILLGTKDEYLERPAEKVLEVYNHFVTSKQYKSVILPGATHSYEGFEKEVVSQIITWVKSI